LASSAQELRLKSQRLLWQAIVIGGACAASGAQAQEAVPAAASALPAPVAAAQPGEGEGLISLTFKDTQVADLIEMIARQGNVEITVNEDVQGTIRFINLQDKTPEEAIRRVALAGNLQWRKVGLNSYIVAKSLPPEETPTQAITTPDVPSWNGNSGTATWIQPPVLPPDAIPDLSRAGVDSDGN
jgi:type II secretory pathway component HofQ